MGGVKKLEASVKALHCFKGKVFQELLEKHPDKQVDLEKLHQRCLDRWAKLSPAQQRFFEPPEKKLKKRRLKDPSLPKRPLSPFLWFCNENRTLVQDQHPEWSLIERTRELGRWWQNADKEVKDRFRGLAARDSLRYKNEMKVYSTRDQGKGHPKTLVGGGMVKTKDVGEAVGQKAPEAPATMEENEEEDEESVVLMQL